MSDPTVWLEAVRRSHDRLSNLVTPLGAPELRRQSGSSEWTVAQVLSHLGSQAEIFSLFVESGLGGGAGPPQEAFEAIWDEWNARSPEDQASRSFAANEALVARIEGLGSEVLGAFHQDMFGRNVDAASLLRMRLSEHAVHTWDVAVAFDPSAEVAADAVELLVDGLAQTAERSGKPTGGNLDATIITESPDRKFRLRAGEDVRLELSGEAQDASRSIELPAEAFVRLVYGRVDGTHPPRGTVREAGVTVADLVAIFPGF